MKTFIRLVAAALLLLMPAGASEIRSLNGNWQIAVDPSNLGKAQKWFAAKPQVELRDCVVPDILERTFPGYDGVVWYWKDIDVPALASNERLLIRFNAADYFAEVWLNGQYVGSHEGGETPFTLDVSKSAKPGRRNFLAVRLINPGSQRIGGFTLDEIPHGIKMASMRVGGFWNPGGLWQSVELLRVPSVRIRNLFINTKREAKSLNAEVNVQNDTVHDVKASLVLDVYGSNGDPAIIHKIQPVNVSPGNSQFALSAILDQVHSWSPDDPYLYRVDVRLEQGKSTDTQSTTTAFRDFVFRDGYFRLNGKRIFLKSAHSVGHFPIGQHVPVNKELLRRELIYAKTMGFNTVRWLGRTMFPSQLNLCDELGLMVYEESYASWNLKDSPDMKRRFDLSVREMILRDRNHPSLIIWGLLNETMANATFRHAVQMLPLVRSVDPTRMVLLSSGRWDGDWSIGSISNPGTTDWQYSLGSEAPGPARSYQRDEHGYTPGSGDIHMYVARPWQDSDLHFYRTIGDRTKHVFLSEYGNGSEIDPDRIIGLMQQEGARTDLEDYKLYKKMAERLATDWHKWHLDEIFASPSDMITSGQRLHSDQRRIALNAIRSNPNLVGYNLTGLSDQAVEGEGLMTTFRELKPDIVDTMIDGFAPLKWCVFADPVHAYIGATIHVEAVLSNEDVLKAGSYPVRLKIVGPAGLALQKTATLEVPDRMSNPEPPMVFPAFKQDVVLDGPAGKYKIEVSFDKGAAALGRQEVLIGDRDALPAVRSSIGLIGSLDTAATLLREHGVDEKQADSHNVEGMDVLLIAKDPPADDQWLRRVQLGGVAVILEPRDLPSALKGKLVQSAPLYWGRDDIVRPHPIFAGLPSRTIMDLEFYRDVIARYSVTEFPSDVENIVPTFAVGRPGGEGYWSGSNLLIYKVGKGEVIVSTLQLLNNIGRNPAADRILLNLISFSTGAGLHK